MWCFPGGTLVIGCRWFGCNTVRHTGTRCGAGIAFRHRAFEVKSCCIGQICCRSYSCQNSPQHQQVSRRQHAPVPQPPAPLSTSTHRPWQASSLCQRNSMLGASPSYGHRGPARTREGSVVAVLCSSSENLLRRTPVSAAPFPSCCTCQLGSPSRQAPSEVLDTSYIIQNNYLHGLATKGEQLMSFQK